MACIKHQGMDIMQIEDCEACLAEPSSPYATTREQLAPGKWVKHIRTGGMWTVIRVNEDGSIFGQSDMGARRTVKAEHVDRGLELAAYFDEMEKSK